MVYEVLSEVSLRCEFGRKPACREDGGKPYLHKWPSVHLERVHPLMNLGNYFRCGGTFCMDRLSHVMWLHPKQSGIRRFCPKYLPIHGPKR